MSFFSFLGKLFGGVGSQITSEMQHDIHKTEIMRQEALAREFAQNGVRWRVADAEAAGLHPLAALGMSTAAGPSISVGAPSNGAFDFGGMGQDIVRAATATQTEEEREMSRLRLASAKLDVEGKALSNQALLSQVNKMNSAGPAFPGSANLIPGQGNSGLIDDNAMKRVVNDPGRPHSEPGSITSVGYAVNADGSLTPIPSGDVKERIEDNFWHETAHFLRNNVLPNISGGSPPKGYRWNHLKQAYDKKK